MTFCDKHPDAYSDSAMICIDCDNEGRAAVDALATLRTEHEQTKAALATAQRVADDEQRRAEIAEHAAAEAQRERDEARRDLNADPNAEWVRELRAELKRTKDLKASTYRDFMDRTRELEADLAASEIARVAAERDAARATEVHHEKGMAWALSLRAAESRAEAAEVGASVLREALDDLSRVANRINLTVPPWDNAHAGELIRATGAALVALASSQDAAGVLERIRSEAGKAALERAQTAEASSRMLRGALVRANTWVAPPGSSMGLDVQAEWRADVATIRAALAASAEEVAKRLAEHDAKVRAATLEEAAAFVGEHAIEPRLGTWSSIADVATAIRALAQPAEAVKP